MRTGTTATLLAAAVGAMVFGSASGAVAVDTAPGHRLGHEVAGHQRNDCNTTALLGDVTLATPLSGPLDINHETDCVNYSNSGTATQGNSCHTHSVIGSIYVNVATPLEVNNDTNCLNVSKSHVGAQANDCATTSTTGPITAGIAAPKAEISNDVNCYNVSGPGRY